MAAARKSAITMLTLIALDPILHDGQRYQPGESLELSEEQAKPLLALKAVEPAPTKAETKAEAKARADAEAAEAAAVLEAEAKAEVERKAAEDLARSTVNAGTGNGPPGSPQAATPLFPSADQA